MSLSGYVPKQDTYNLKVYLPSQDKEEFEEGTLTVPYGNIVKSFSISNKTWSEWPHPIMLYAVWQKVTFEIDYSCISKYLPATPSAKKVKLMFFERSLSIEDPSTKQFNLWETGHKTRHISKIDLNQWTQRITATIFFRFNRGVTSRNNDALWHLALNIHGVVIKYLVKDIAVFSNQAQVHGFGDGIYHIGPIGQKPLKQSFWFSQKLIANKSQVKSRKRLRPLPPKQEEKEDTPSKKAKEEHRYKAPPVESFFAPREDQNPNPVRVLNEFEDAEQKALHEKLQEMIRLTMKQHAELVALEQSNIPLSESLLHQFGTISQKPFEPVFSPVIEFDQLDLFSQGDISNGFDFGLESYK